MGYFKSFQKSFKKVTSVELSPTLLIIIVAVLLYVFRKQVRGFIKNTTGVEMFSQTQNNDQWHADLSNLSGSWAIGTQEENNPNGETSTSSPGVVTDVSVAGRYDAFGTGQEFFIFTPDGVSEGDQYPIPVKIFDTKDSSGATVEPEFIRTKMIEYYVNMYCRGDDANTMNIMEGMMRAILNGDVMQGISNEMPNLTPSCEEVQAEVQAPPGHTDSAPLTANTLQGSPIEQTTRHPPHHHRHRHGRRSQGNRYVHDGGLTENTHEH